MRQYIDAMQLDITVRKLERDIKSMEDTAARISSIDGNVSRMRAYIRDATIAYINAYELRAVHVHRMMQTRDDANAIACAMVG